MSLSDNRNDQSGVTLVIVAVSLTGLMAIAGLAVDGGRSYAARRQVQNAADAAAFAGAQALFSYQYAVVAGTTASNNVSSSVVDKLQQNQSISNTVCNYVKADSSSDGACTNTPPSDAAGVQVHSANTHNTSFMAVLGIAKFTAKATATAMLQPVVATGAAPFIACGSPVYGWPILKADGSIDTATAIAAGPQPLQAAKVASCGAGDSFKGKAADSVTQVSIGSYELGGNGNGYVQSIRDTVAGLVPCIPPSFTGCDMILPIADSGYGNGKDKIYLHIEAFGVFHITGDGTGNPKYYGAFEAPANVATGGSGEFGVQCVVGTQLCVIKLTA